MFKSIATVQCILLHMLLTSSMTAAQSSSPSPFPIGSVVSSTSVASSDVFLPGEHQASDQFGSFVEEIGDIDGDGVQDMGISAVGDDDGAADAGAMYVAFMRPNGTTSRMQKISCTAGGLDLAAESSMGLGSSIAGLY